MARQRTPWGAQKTFILFATCLALFSFIPIIFSIVIFSVSFILTHASFFLMSALFALALALAWRLSFIETVPEKTLGILVNGKGDFKAVLPAARYRIGPFGETLKHIVSLEPSAMQFPLLDLKASDGDVTPQVALCKWRVRADVPRLLLRHRQQIENTLMTTHQKREQEVRDHVEVVIRQQMQQRTAARIQTELADTLQRPFEQGVVREVNPLLEPLGLQVDQLEFIGAGSMTAKPVAAGKAAEEARKQIAGARQKLKQVLQPPTPGVTPQEVAQAIWKAYEGITEVRKEVGNLANALNAYVVAVGDVFQPLYNQAKPRPNIKPMESARQQVAGRLKQLQSNVGTLGNQLIQLDQQAKQLSAAPFGLTPSECDRLLEVLDAIERKIISLEKLYP